MDPFLAALPLVLDPVIVLSMVAGVAAGIVLGALPGLTATLGIAVLLPFTYGMAPINALALMAGLYNGAMYGGAIPAILVGIPGTPSGVATTFDGVPMARTGRARLALQVALLSSALGSFLSALSLILLAPVLVRFALHFGPAEYFWVAVFGLTSIAMLMSGDPLKGLVSAILGVLVGLVGIDPISGQERLTLGLDALAGGVNLIILLTGLYAVPPALDLLLTARRRAAGDPDAGAGAGREVGAGAGPGLSWRLVSGLVPTWLRSGLLGIIIGIIPGAGGNLASFLSWTQERRWVRRDNRFGEGDPRGVAASECGNNADNAAAMIPALTLGVPGNSVAAMILGGLMIHGLQPGPALFRNNPEIVHGFMWEMLLTAPILLIVGVLGAGLFARAMRIPPAVMAPMILVVTTIGAYATQNAMSDVWIMLGIGGVGVMLTRAGFPLAPIIIGAILGPMAESNARRAVLLMTGDATILVGSPITWVLIAMTGAVVLVPLARRLRRRHPRRETRPAP
ncbi:tripartite tricarboxylate transporter permease [Roseospira visakhapatnamensis]|uniref:Putative tricarboxylic transport membrane protein n=1 Tax=Roseospira visakhapatnamensis TaxID=390880 RepID=A0A7W6RBV4_9PROT|nr:tripartite tricarboxylate transporter permease [Roseospira visakhapatnamensis]MBB4265646.1 putative tricarboxylic transport membrane protein [Roseospira visakhapatnamensis]